MLSPAMFIIVAFIFVPLLLSVWISFHSWNMLTPISQMQWKGLDNYSGLLHDLTFRTALKNTAVYVVLAVVIEIPLAVLLAMLLFLPKIRGKALVRTILFGTYVVPTVAVSIVWGQLYAPNYGPLSRMFSAIGLGDLTFLSSPSTALLSLVVFHIWQMLGYYVVLVIAGLTQIPQELYEAAGMDGAGPIRQTFSVTLPLLRPTLAFVMVIAVVNSIQIFDPAYILTQGGPANSTDVISLEIQRAAFQNGLAGQASAMAVSLLVVLVAIGGALAAVIRRRS